LLLQLSPHTGWGEQSCGCCPPVPCPARRFCCAAFLVLSTEPPRGRGGKGPPEVAWASPWLKHSHPEVPSETLLPSSTVGSPCKRPRQVARPPKRLTGKQRAQLLTSPLRLTLCARQTQLCPKHHGSARLLHHSLLITLCEERLLLLPGPPGTATRRAGWPIKPSVGLVVPPHPSPSLGSSSRVVHVSPAALSSPRFAETCSPTPLLSPAGALLRPPAAPGREEAGQDSPVNNCSNPNINRKIQPNEESTS